MAIEDAASIAQLLPEGTPASQIPKRLKFYERIRHARATWVQEQTRINGMDEAERPPSECWFSSCVPAVSADIVMQRKEGLSC